jgi:AraC family transcriptional regulator
MRTPVEKAIWFIESHFSRDVTLDDLARVCGLSRFQMSRLFSYATGKTVTGYVRGRRLSEAARALADGAPDILAVALVAGYGSHEAFTRAFRDEFGLGPAELRARGSLEGIQLIEPLREDPAVAIHLPPPRIVAQGPLLIAGIGRRFAFDDFAGIPALWQQLHPYLGAIAGEKRNATYGVVANMTPGGDTYFYLAGVEVSDLSDLDGDLTGFRLPAQRWAIFPHEGHVTTIASTIDAVFTRALPAAGLTPGDMPDLLERYDERFDPWGGGGGFEIWVPVKKGVTRSLAQANS